MITARVVGRIEVDIRGRVEIFSEDEARGLINYLIKAMTPEPSDIADVRAEVCRAFGVSFNEMNSDCRTDRIAFARQVAMWIVRETTAHSSGYIGQCFPKANRSPRNHGTVLHACKAVEKRMSTEPRMKEKIKDILKTITTKPKQETSTP